MQSSAKNPIDEAFAAWSQVHAQLVQAEQEWGAVVVTGTEPQRRAADRQVRKLRAQSEALLRRASATLEARSGRPGARA